MALGLTAALMMTGCGKAQTTDAVVESETETLQETTEETTTEETSQETAEESTEESEEEVAMSTNPKQVVVYFANWNLNEKPADAGGEVASIPWDSVSYVNHAFWAVVPADGSTETSTERRNNGEEARTEFKIVSTDPKNDYYLMMKDIPAEKLCIGSPMYAMALQMKSIPSGTVVGTAIESYKPTDHEIDEEELSGYIADAVSGYTIKQDGLRYVMDEEFDQGTAGWHMGYDKNNGAAYLYNDDESSSYYKWYLSYEDALSLQGKLDYIQEKGLAGIIVWESSLDLPTHEYIRQMGDQLLGE